MARTLASWRGPAGAAYAATQCRPLPMPRTMPRSHSAVSVRGSLASTSPGVLALPRNPSAPNLAPGAQTLQLSDLAKTCAGSWPGLSAVERQRQQQSSESEAQCLCSFWARPVVVQDVAGLSLPSRSAAQGPHGLARRILCFRDRLEWEWLAQGSGPGAQASMHRAVAEFSQLTHVELDRGKRELRLRLGTSIGNGVSSGSAICLSLQSALDLETLDRKGWPVIQQILKSQLSAQSGLMLGSRGSKQGALGPSLVWTHA
eukprot:gnl/TRDRNA2_/TRDRNA2_43650_c0_seq1.p1 gnl/TRDRNA2_/TRDRNA2_43650_c0~~gnl/TRDRNA2_/TRDRNA2_43650_c0_seq1.p1  ORF type:complete len:276 (-),score=22.82 gnl/TRDRNA2_/TRDRNA2_43650_c0_seq1:49-825(-)